MDSAAIGITAIEEAAEALAAVVGPTPLIYDTPLDDIAGRRLALKVESLQRTGAFKFRGGYNAVRLLDPAQRAAGVVAFSSGNHARAVATAAGLLDSSAVIVMPHDAPPEKVAATEAAGGRVVRYDRYRADRAEIAARIAEQEGRVVIPPFDHPAVIAGQGTVALEMIEQAQTTWENEFDSVFVCVGGGGLLAGCATVFESRSPATSLFGVEPEASDDHVRSRAAGERVEIPVPRTIADGQQLPSPGALTWPITNALATDFLTVTDDEIIATMSLLFEHCNLVVEPSGACALAAVLFGPDRPDIGERVGVTISGGNISHERFTELVGDR